MDPRGRITGSIQAHLTHRGGREGGRASPPGEPAATFFAQVQARYWERPRIHHQAHAAGAGRTAFEQAKRIAYPQRPSPGRPIAATRTDQLHIDLAPTAGAKWDELGFDGQQG